MGAEISTWTSLGVILAAMAVSVIASLIKIRVDARRDAATELTPSE